MKIETLGEEEPEIVLVCGIHGDEPEGREALEILKENVGNGSLKLHKSVKLIIANEKALEAGERFIDTDMNRAYPGNKDSELHEERLAAKLVEEVRGKTMIDLHTTKSDKSFVIITDEREETLQNARFTGFDKVVNFEFIDDSIIPDTIRVTPEVSRGERAVEELYECVLNFLKGRNLIEGECRIDQEVFRINGRVDGSGFKFTGTNFVEIQEGEIFARKEDEEIRADHDFYPVLMSDNGYDEMVGFTAEKVQVS